MSFEILENEPQTMYAPLNTTIDADRDYRDLTGLDSCPSCAGAPPRMIPPGMNGLDGLELDGLDAAEDTFNWKMWLTVAAVGYGLYYYTQMDREPDYG
jgi:hypothetical protein